MRVSVVVPCYRSELTLEVLVERLLRSLDGLRREGTIDGFEIILVVDGSPDNTAAIAQGLVDASPHVTAMLLRRNFGQHNALVAGIRAARFDVVVTLDDDLQHPPEEIGTLLHTLDPATDLVYAVPVAEQHGFLRSLASRAVKTALRMAGVPNATWVGAFRAFRTDLRDGFSGVNDASVNVDVLLSWVTTRVRAVRVRMEPRAAGHSSYDTGRLLRHTANMVTGYGTVPLKLAAWLGFACGLLGVVLLVVVVVMYFVGETTVPGFTTIAALISLFAGAQMLTIGIIGEYVARQHFRSMSRPMYVIGEVRSGNDG
jgi:glycosyltransferase involved in cell wall biosynthesis